VPGGQQGNRERHFARVKADGPSERDHVFLSLAGHAHSHEESRGGAENDLAMARNMVIVSMAHKNNIVAFLRLAGVEPQAERREAEIALAIFWCESGHRR